MKSFTYFILLTIITFTLSGNTSMGIDYVIGLSPYYSKQDKDLVFKAVLQFLLEELEDGKQIQVYDAWNLEPIAACKIPEGKIFKRNPRARFERLRTSLGKIKKFFVQQSITNVAMTGAINVPEFLELAGRQMRSDVHPMEIIIIGSPFYVNLNEPSFNTKDAYPSDAHLYADTQQTVFSVADKREVLNFVWVHYGLVNASFINSHHKNRLARFWSLFVYEQNGTLCTFATDIGLAFERAAMGVKEPFMSARINSEDQKVEMRQVVKRSVPNWMRTNSKVQASTSLVNTVPNNQIIHIGIMWDSNQCDFDLWVKPTESSRDLFFGRRVTPEGKYFHDYRNPNSSLDYEHVELKRGVDIRRVKAWVNFFRGRTTNPEGKIRIKIGNRVYHSSFKIESKEGSGGDGYLNRSNHPSWIEIDIAKIIGLQR